MSHNIGGRPASEIVLLFFKVSSYYHQLALSQATGDKGPTGPGGFPPDPFQYLQAQVGPVGPRGPPGIINISERFMGVGGSFGKSDQSLPSLGSLKKIVIYKKGNIAKY
jgi:hypothetical protein